MKRIAAVFLALAVMVMVAGCDHFLPEPLAFTVVGDVPIVRTCIPLVVSSQSIGTYPGEEEYQSKVVWSADGSIDLPEGSEFALTTPLDGFEQSGEVPVDLVDSEFSYEIYVDSGVGGDWSTWSHFDAGELKEGVWLDSYGGVLETPCTHPPCAQFAACFNNWPQPTGEPTESLPTFVPAN